MTLIGEALGTSEGYGKSLDAPRTSWARPRTASR